MTIKVTSNSEAQAESQAAQGVADEVEGSQSAPVADDAAEQKKSSESDIEETEEPEAKDESEEESDEDESKDAKKAHPKKKSGWQRRIDKLNAAKADAQREAEYWKRAALEKQEQSAPKKEAPQVETKVSQDGEPSPDSFDNHVDYVRALTKWEIAQSEGAKQAEVAKAKQLAEHQKLVTAYSDREKSFAAKTEDYAEVLEGVGEILVSPALRKELLESDNGPELAYELAKNPEEFKRINSLHPSAVARALGRLEAKLPASSAEEKKPEPKKLTNAPRPLEPVGNGKGVVAKSIHDKNLTQREYERLRREQMKQRHG